MTEDLNPNDPKHPFGPVRRATAAHRADSARMWATVERALDEDTSIATIRTIRSTRTGGAGRTGRASSGAPRPRTGLTIAVAASTVLAVLATPYVAGSLLAGGDDRGQISVAGPDASAGVRTASRGGTADASAPSRTGSPSPTAGNSPRAGTSPRPGASGAGPSQTVQPTALSTATSDTSGATPGTGSSPWASADSSSPLAGGPSYAWTVLSSSSSRSITLPGPKMLDWVYPGSRNDLKLQRAKKTPGGEVLGISVPGGASSTSSPLRVSWTDGSPEQDRMANAQWLTVRLERSVTVVVPSATTARQLKLYLGGDAHIELVGGRGSTEVTSRPGESDPSILTVDVPSGSGLTVILTGRSTFSLGPVVLVRA